ncbi:MAG: hypothetical protein ACYC42_01735, partial [Lysobacter sp.]
MAGWAALSWKGRRGTSGKGDAGCLLAGIVILGIPSLAIGAVPGQVAADTQKSATVVFWLAVLTVSITLLLLLTALVVGMLATYRSRRMPNRQAQDALLAARS